LTIGRVPSRVSLPLHAAGRALAVVLLALASGGAAAQELAAGTIAPATPYVIARPRAEWLAQAQHLERQGRWDELHQLGRQWTRSESHEALAWFVLGRAASGLQRHGEAIAAYRQAVALEPGDVYSINNLGQAYRDSGQTGEAMRTWREAIRVNPDYIDAWHNIGLTFYARKGQAGVVQALQQLRAVDPALAEVWRRLAVDYTVSRDERVAREAVQVLRRLSEAQRSRMFAILFAGL